MAVQYNRLFKMMIDKKMSPAELRDKAGISANIITHLRKDESISLSSIEKICRVLHCGVDDILEFIPDEDNGEVNKND